jgi:hypothetical protein
MSKFWINAPHYLRLKGRTEPEYIDASPNNPVVVELDDNTKVVKEDRTLRAYEDKPEKPLPVHPPAKKPEVKKTPEFQQGGRAADR